MDVNEPLISAAGLLEHINVDARDSNHDDAAYEPGQPRTPRSSRSTALTVFTTPPQNIQHGSGISDSARDRLVTASNGRRCVITLSERYPECAHILRRSTKRVELTTLEYVWGLGFGTLNLDTTQNMMWLSPQLHTYFDAGDWGLLPSLDLLEEIQAAVVRETAFETKPKFTKTFPRATRGYDFVHFIPATEALLRFDSTTPPYSIHEPPYTTLSPIRLHVHPYFVICNIAQKDRKHHPKLSPSNPNPSYETLTADVLRRVRLCRTIYSVWITQESVASGALKNQLDPPATPHSSAHSSTSRRSNPERRAKRSRNDNPGGNLKTVDEGGSSPGHDAPSTSTVGDSICTPEEFIDVGDGMGFQDYQQEVMTANSRTKVTNWLMDHLGPSECPPDSVLDKPTEAAEGNAHDLMVCAKAK